MKIQLNKVGKRFRYEWILDNIDLVLSCPGSYAIMGPNGSGKSTLLKLVAGYLSPSSGKISYTNSQGAELSRDLIYQYIDIAAPYIDLIESFSMIEVLEFHQKFTPLMRDWSINKIIEELKLPISPDAPIRQYSSGMKQRLKLAMTILSQSEILLLDEPTTNLDAQGISWYQTMVQKHLKDRIVLIASNTEVDFHFCEHQIDILQYKEKH